MSDIPKGYCQCGCGKRTSIADRNNVERGWIKGQPMPFLAGHHRRLVPFTDYQREINSLIPKAEDRALLFWEKLGCPQPERRRGVMGSWTHHDFLTELFHREMNRLAYEKGLRPWK